MSASTRRRRSSPTPTIGRIAAPSSARSAARSITCWSPTASGCAASPARARNRRGWTRSCSTTSPRSPQARAAEDARIIAYVDGLSEADLENTFSYHTITRPAAITQKLAPALAHFFNHQTHHRGQAHTLLTIAGGRDAAPPLDLIYFQRETGIGLT